MHTKNEQDEKYNFPQYTHLFFKVFHFLRFAFYLQFATIYFIFSTFFLFILYFAKYFVHIHWIFRFQIGSTFRLYYVAIVTLFVVFTSTNIESLFHFVDLILCFVNRLVLRNTYEKQDIESENDFKWIYMHISYS